MRIIRHLPALLILLLLAACSGDGMGPRELRGEWRQSFQSGSGDSWSKTDVRLELRGDGSYTRGSTTHAAWGRPGDKLLGYARVHGRFEVRGDSLYLTARRVERWDYLTGGPFEDDVNGQATQAFRARVAGDRLILTYVSYPADAPEETESVYHRD
jgi:hypothetical protein